MERKASAVWKGGLKDGKGEFSAPSGVFSHVPYSFKTRFEDAPGRFEPHFDRRRDSPEASAGTCSDDHRSVRIADPHAVAGRSWRRFDEDFVGASCPGERPKTVFAPVRNQLKQSHF